MSKDSQLVYSTDTGRVKPQKNAATAVHEGSKDGVVRLERQTKGRKGKGVTLVTGLPGKDTDLKTLAKTLKQQCGVGGSVKAGVVEIQTDDRAKIKQLLEAKGYTVKIAGG